MSGGGTNSNRSVVFVLGMHRSGTSAFSRMLSLLGCDLPKTLMPESAANSSGFWESIPIMELNDEILRSGGSQWNDWLPFNPNWYVSPVYESFVDRGVAAIREQFGSSPLFVMKDPRCARLVQYWQAVFERESIRPLVIVPIRNPIEVANSLASHHHLNIDVVHLIWLRHVLDAERDTRGMARAFATYEDLLTNWTALAVRLQGELGISWPGLSALSGSKIDDFLDPGIRHNEVPSETLLSNPLLAEWLRDTYAIMLRWASDGESAADYDKLDGIKHGFDAAGPAFMGITQALMIEASRSQGLQASLGQKGTEVSDLSHEIAALHNALESTRAELAAKVAEISAQADQHLADGNVHDEIRQAELARSEAEAQGLRETLASLETALLQRDEDIQRAGGETASASQRADALEAEKHQIEARLHAADAVAREQEAGLRASAEALERAEADSHALRDRLAELEAALQQREAELERAGSDTVSASQRADALATEKHEIELRLHAAEHVAQEQQAGLRAGEVAAQQSDAEIRALRDQLAAVEGALLQRDEDITRVESENIAAFQRAEALDAEKRAIEERLEAAENAAREQQGVLRASDDVAQRAEQDILALRDQLAYVESTLRQREEEIAQTGSEKAAAYEQIELLEGQKRTIEQKLGEADAWVFRLAEERYHSQAQINRLQSDIKAKERALSKVAANLQSASDHIARLNDRNAAARLEIEQYRQERQALSDLNESGRLEIERYRQEHKFLTDLHENGRLEVEQYRREHQSLSELHENGRLEIERYRQEHQTLSDLHENGRGDDHPGSHDIVAAITAELQHVTAENGVLAERMGERIREIAQLSGMLFDKQNQVADLAARQDDLESLASRHLREVEQLQAASRELRASNERLSAEIQSVYAANTALEAGSRRYRSEVSTLSSKLISEQRQVGQSARETEWLRRVIPVMTRTRWWDKMVTKAWLARRNHMLLRRKGLFDVDDYIARYPDVAAEGMDPLLHFIRHGMSEGRIGMTLPSD